MKTKTQKQGKSSERSLVIEATTSDSPIPAFISLLRPAFGEWPDIESGFASPILDKKAVVR